MQAFTLTRPSRADCALDRRSRAGTNISPAAPT